MKDVRCARNADGTLHANNPNHPGVTEDDMIAVLSGPALVAPDARGRKNRFEATAATEGRYDVLTVVYHEGKVLTAITAWPARADVRAAYLEAINKGGEGLWTPANDTE